MKCLFCNHFKTSKIILRDNEEPGKKKKGQVNHIKKCHIANLKIDADTDACDYFNPSESFYCDKQGHYVPNMILCLQRRLNIKRFESFKKCKRCQTFQRIIKPILEKYYIRLEKILPPPELKPKLKKRKKLVVKPKKRKPIKIKSKKLRRRIKKK